MRLMMFPLVCLVLLGALMGSVQAGDCTTLRGLPVATGYSFQTRNLSTGAATCDGYGTCADTFQATGTYSTADLASAPVPTYGLRTFAFAPRSYYNPSFGFTTFRGAGYHVPARRVAAFHPVPVPVPVPQPRQAQQNGGGVLGIARAIVATGRNVARAVTGVGRAR